MFDWERDEEAIQIRLDRLWNDVGDELPEEFIPEEEWDDDDF